MARVAVPVVRISLTEGYDLESCCADTGAATRTADEKRRSKRIEDDRERDTASNT
jgi:hypothetical protein